MNITPTTFTIADYCTSMERNEIVVDKDYQRSEKVWPAAARSFLIESILLGYPIPKLYLYQVTDLKSRKTIKHIVDGQQRSYTILDFFKNGFALSQACEIDGLGGKTFEQLPTEWQQKFVDYALSVDLFISASNDEIREVFRRINSYTVPLNPEEKRHSQWQGAFKWFIYKIAKKYDQTFINVGVFKDRQLVRMADTKLLSEITYAILNGITTTNSPSLDKLYKEFDDKFEHSKAIEARISKAIDTIVSWPEIHKTELMKPHIFYGLVLAITHLNKPIEKLNQYYLPRSQGGQFRSNIIINLTALADVLSSSDDSPKKYDSFAAASAKTTNDGKRRAQIFEWLCKAIELQKI